jgi:glutamine synthetase
VEEDLYHMAEGERRKRRIQTLPGSLLESVESAEESELVRSTLGEHVFEKFIANKKIEWDRYRVQVTTYELERYLPIL